MLGERARRSGVIAGATRIGVDELDIRNGERCDAIRHRLRPKRLDRSPTCSPSAELAPLERTSDDENVVNTPSGRTSAWYSAARR